MRLNVSLEQRNELHLTAELGQAIQILEMPLVELVPHLQNAVYENPFLDIDDPSRAAAKESLTEGVAEQTDKMSLDDKSVEAISERLYRQTRFLQHGEERQRRNYDFEQYLTQQKTLKDQLEEQVALELDGADELKAALFLIGNLDNNGYLRVDATEAAALLGLPVKKVERALSVLQSCHPAGVAARNLGESLILQLKARGDDSPLALQIVSEHLKDLAAGKLPKIAAQLQVSVRDVQEIVDVIRDLSPRPGLAYGRSMHEHVVAELAVQVHDEGFTIRLLDLDIPKLSLAQGYIDLMQDCKMNKETKKYLSECLRSAKSLISGVDHRRETLYHIAHAIMQRQTKFLKQGPLFIQPLTMHEIAEITEVSESTVSRIVNRNYIQTPHGIYELRSFFSSAAGAAVRAGASPASKTDSSQNISSASAKQLLKELVAQEDRSNPLSDTQLLKLLSDRGISVSRRTVNKYRNALGIPGHLQRKRY
jgi:RNA polymerase sigma-54 factor